MIAVKACSKCGEVKDVLFFYFSKRISKHLSSCKKCSRAAVSAYKKTLDRNAVLAYKKAYYLANREKIAVLNKSPGRREKQYESQRKHQRKRTDDEVRRRKAKNYSSPSENLKHIVARRIRNALQGIGCKKASRTHEILGCDYDFFKGHIERQFPKGMTWENRDAWHIDHITPMSTAKTEGEVLALNHFTNLRPMWAKDNRAKSDKITHLI